MATPKRKTVECPLQVSCDGVLIQPTATACALCKRTLERRQRAQLVAQSMQVAS